MADAVFISDAEGRFLDFNDAFATFHRFQSKKECATSFAEYPDILDVFLADGTLAPVDKWAVPRALRGEVGANAEYALRRKDSGETWVGSFSFSPIRDQDGAIAGSVVVARDITDSKRAEAELRNQREWLRVTLSSIADAVLATDAEGKVTFLNPVAASLTGWTQDQALGHPAHAVFRTIDEARLEEVEDIVARVLSEGHVVSLPDRTALVAGGRRKISIEATAAPIRDGAGNMLGAVLVFRDTTEEHRAQEVLRESEGQFRTLANAIPQLCSMANADGYIFWYNDRWYEYTGTTPEQMEGWGWQSVHDPQELPRVLGQWKDSIATGLPFSMVFPLLGGDGVFRPFLTRIMPVRDRDGKVARWFGTNTDISEQRKIEEALRESEERLRLAQQAARIGTFEWNIQTGVNRWTPELEAMYGLPPGGFAGTQRAWEDLVYPEDRAEALRRVRASLDTGNFEAEWRIQRPDGTVRWLAGRAWVFKDEQGKPLRLIGVHIDITERRAAEESSRQWQRAFEQAELGIALSDSRTGTLRTVNESFARERGYTVPELEGGPISALFPAASHAVLDAAVTIADRDGHVAFESAHQRKDGSCFPVRVDLTAVHNEAGDRVSRVAFVQDLTTQKEAEQQIRQLNAELEKRVRERTAQLEAANRELEAFAYSVSHDLRAPLRGIDGWSLALVEDYGDRLDEQAHKFLDRVRSETQRMGLLIDDMLQLSRITRSEMSRDTVNLTSVARAVAAELREAHADRHIEFIIAPELRLPAMPGCWRLR